MIEDIVDGLQDPESHGNGEGGTMPDVSHNRDRCNRRKYPGREEMYS